MKILSDGVQVWGQVGRTIFGLGFGYTPAVLAAGYIIGIEVAMSLFTGVVIGWIILLPIIGLIYGIPHGGSAYEIAMDLWTRYLRYVGVGTMLVGGLWTLLSLLKPISQGLKLSLASLRKNNSEAHTALRTERDMPLNWVLALVLLVAVLAFGFLLFYFHHSHITSFHDYVWVIVLISILFILIVGFLTTTISSYFCGLVGSSNNPISGILIMVILLLSFIYLLLFRVTSSEQARYIASAVLVVGTIIAAIGSIGGETIQDLKAGRMVGATPWKQQLMMIIGISASSLIIGPVLQLLFQAYGMGGVYPRPGMDPAQMLAAPQAGLMSTIVEGVLLHHLQWTMIIIGGVVAVFLIIGDEILKRKNLRLPALAVGLGIYLPSEIIMPIVIGGVVSALVKRRKKGQKDTPELRETVLKQHQQGILMACGMVAGSALMGVILAIPFVIMGSANALSVVPTGFIPIANLLGTIVFIGLCYWFYQLGRLKT